MPVKVRQSVKSGRNPSGRQDNIRIAVRPDAPNLLRWLNMYLDKYVGLLDAEAVRKGFNASPWRTE